MLTIYGIKTCDTCRKALKFLEKHGVEHKFHDVRGDKAGRDASHGVDQACRSRKSPKRFSEKPTAK